MPDVVAAAGEVALVTAASASNGEGAWAFAIGAGVAIAATAVSDEETGVVAWPEVAIPSIASSCASVWSPKASVTSCPFRKTNKWGMASMLYRCANAGLSSMLIFAIFTFE